MKPVLLRRGLNSLNSDTYSTYNQNQKTHKAVTVMAHNFYLLPMSSLSSKAWNRWTLSLIYRLSEQYTVAVVWLLKYTRDPMLPIYPFLSLYLPLISSCCLKYQSLKVSAMETIFSLQNCTLVESIYLPIFIPVIRAL